MIPDDNEDGNSGGDSGDGGTASNIGSDDSGGNIGSDELRKRRKQIAEVKESSKIFKRRNNNVINVNPPKITKNEGNGTGDLFSSDSENVISTILKLLKDELNISLPNPPPPGINYTTDPNDIPPNAPYIAIAISMPGSQNPIMLYIYSESKEQIETFYADLITTIKSTVGTPIYSSQSSTLWSHSNQNGDSIILTINTQRF